MRQAAIHTPAHADDNDTVEFLRITSVMRRIGLGRSTIYRLIAEQSFPAPVKLAGRAVGWRRSDLELWSAARPSTTH